MQYISLHLKCTGVHSSLVREQALSSLPSCLHLRDWTCLPLCWHCTSRLVRIALKINATLTLAEWPGNCGTEQAHHTAVNISMYQLYSASTFFSSSSLCLWIFAQWNTKFTFSSCLVTSDANGHKLQWKSWKYSFNILLSKWQLPVCLKVA